MQFRPCIDIHDGRVKQIVGGSLTDGGATENFVSDMTAADYAALYRKQGLRGGHIILLNHAGQPAYASTKDAALSALRAYPGGLMAGGGITPENAMEFIEAGASHVIVTSYVFHDGRIDYGRIEELVRTVGRDHLVLDLSCRSKDGRYYVVTDRWQRYTEEEVTPELLQRLSQYAAEYLIHAADVEGRVSGIERPLIDILAMCRDVRITYAGGIATFDDIRTIAQIGQGRIDITIGSALDLFGGALPYADVLQYIEQVNAECRIPSVSESGERKGLHEIHKDAWLRQ